MKHPVALLFAVGFAGALLASCAPEQEAGILCESDADCDDADFPICHRITGTCIPADTLYQGEQSFFLAGSFECPVVTAEELARDDDAVRLKLLHSRAFLSGRLGDLTDQDTNIRFLRDNGLLPTNLFDDEGRVVVAFQSQCYALDGEISFTHYLPDAKLQLTITGKVEGSRKYRFPRYQAVFGLQKVNPLRERSTVLVGLGNLLAGDLLVAEKTETTLKGKLASTILPYTGEFGLGDACRKNTDCGQTNFNYCIGGACVAFCTDDTECVGNGQFGRCTWKDRGLGFCLGYCDADTECPAGARCRNPESGVFDPNTGGVNVCYSDAANKANAQYYEYTGEPYDPDTGEPVDYDEFAPDVAPGNVPDPDVNPFFQNADAAPGAGGAGGSGGSGNGGSGGSGSGGSGGSGNGGSGGSGNGGSGGSGNGGSGGSGGSGSGGSGGSGNGGSGGSGGSGNGGSGGSGNGGSGGMAPGELPAGGMAAGGAVP